MNAPSMKAESRAYFRALGQHLAELRKLHGMTQADVAKLLRVSQQTVFAYELGDRRVNLLVLMKLSRIFNVPVDQLMGMTNQAPPLPQQRLSPAGVRHAERYQALSKTRQRFVKKIIDVLLEEEDASANTEEE